MKTSPTDRIINAELQADNFPAEDGRAAPARAGSWLQASVAQTPALLPPPASTGSRRSRGGSSGSSRTFRVSATVGCLAAGLALIAYSAGRIHTNANVSSSMTSVPPAKMPSAAPPASAEGARTAVSVKTVKMATGTRPPSPRPIAAVKKRPAGSPRSTSADRASTGRSLAGAEKPRRRNFLGLRTVAGWFTGPKADRSDKPDRKSAAGKPNASARQASDSPRLLTRQPTGRAEAVK